MQVGVVLLCVVIAYVSAETCHHTRECSHVKCPENDYAVMCENHECTCVHVAGSCLDTTCTTKDDCSDCNCHHVKRDHHCIDSVCHCGIRPVGK